MKRLMALTGLILLVNSSLVNATVSDTEFRQMLTQALVRIKELEQHHETSMDTHVPSMDVPSMDAHLAVIAMLPKDIEVGIGLATGGTDSKGFKLAGKYMLTEQASLGFTYYHTERQDNNGVGNGSPLTSNPFDVNTLQVNVLFKAK